MSRLVKLRSPLLGDFRSIAKAINKSAQTFQPERLFAIHLEFTKVQKLQLITELELLLELEQLQ